MGEKFIDKCNEEFDEKTMMKIVIRDIFLKQMWSIRKLYLILISIYNFYRREKKFKKVEKLICSIEDQQKYVVHIRVLKEALNHGLKLKKYTE